jgi:hypothetical protein
MRRIVAIALAAVLVAGVAIADAAVPKGTYTGRFSDGGKVSLVVNKERLLIKVTRRALRFKCSDGDKFSSLKSVASGDVDVSDGTFDIGDTATGDGVVWDMQGKFSTKKRKVKGTYRETRRFNSKNRLDENGTIVCETAALTYSAALPKKK